MQLTYCRFLALIGYPQFALLDNYDHLTDFLLVPIT